MTTPYSDAALAQEIRTDPLPMGYAGKDANGIWQLLTDTTKGRPVEIHSVDAFDLLGALDPAELATTPLPAFPHQWVIDKFLDALNHSTGKVDPRDPRFTRLCAAVFPTAQYAQTNAALVALGSGTGSRSEELWGAGIFPSLVQVQFAMPRP